LVALLGRADGDRHWTGAEVQKLIATVVIGGLIAPPCSRVVLPALYAHFGRDVCAPQREEYQAELRSAAE
jgi:hypothetical protein